MGDPITRLVALALALAACGDGGGGDDGGTGAAASGGATSGGGMCSAAYSSSCHHESSGSDCWDYYGLPQGAKGECEADGGVWNTTPCEPAMSSGGCRHVMGVGVCGVRWDFDADTTAAQVEETCGGLQGTYLPP